MKFHPTPTTLAFCAALAFAPACVSQRSERIDAFERGEFQTAFESSQPLATDGDADSQYLVGLMHDEGRGVPVDRALAAHWYALAAQYGHAAAQCNLGLLCFRGDGVERSTELATQWFERSSAQNFARAQGNLAVLLLLGHTSSGDRSADHARATELLRASSTAGDARSSALLAVVESGGAPTPENEAFAFTWLRSAAERGAPGASFAPSAAFATGSMLLQGRGVPADARSAAQWFERAAIAGDASAQANLGRLYLQGLGVVRDDEQGARWLRAAAEQEHADAQHDLGLLYARGRGVARDIDQAERWIERSAANGCQRAIEKLAQLRARSRAHTPDLGALGFGG